ncbi:MAG: hypothetical protein ACRCUP_03060 [Mycoplasmatales bacterium]
MSKTTEEFTSDLTKEKAIDEFEFEKPIQLVELIEQKLCEKKCKKADVIKACNLDLKNGYKYLNGERSLTRDLLIKILVFFEMPVKDIQVILTKSGFASLYVKHKRDMIIYKGILHSYSLKQINNELSKHNELLLW